jgi:hypothetical protein
MAISVVALASRTTITIEIGTDSPHETRELPHLVPVWVGEPPVNILLAHSTVGHETDLGR